MDDMEVMILMSLVAVTLSILVVVTPSGEVTDLVLEIDPGVVTDLAQVVEIDPGAVTDLAQVVVATDQARDRNQPQAKDQVQWIENQVRGKDRALWIENQAQGKD